MAKVLYGTGITEFRGKVGGSIFSANGSGAYVKSYARPPRRHTTAQNDPIAVVAGAGYLWQSLSDGDRTDWNDYAADPGELDYDAWGNQRYLSGFQWMTRCMGRRWACAETALSGVPAKPAEAAVTGAVLTVYQSGAEHSTIEWDSSQFGADKAAVLFLSVSPSSGIATAQKGFYQVLAKYDPDDTSEDIQDGIDAQFPFLQIGWTIHGRLYKQTEPGDRSPVIVLVTTVLEQP